MNSHGDVRYCSKLIAVLEDAVERTTQTKQVLRVNCVEIKRLLRHWCVSEKGSVQESECVCQISEPVPEEADEIVKTVEERLEYAQKLRKNVAISRKSGSKPTRSGTSSSRFMVGSNVTGLSELTSRVEVEIGKTVGVMNGVDNKLARSNKISCHVGDASSSSSLSETRLPFGGDNLRKSKNMPRTSTKSASNINFKPRNDSSLNLNKAKSSTGGRTSIKLKDTSHFQTTYRKDFSVRSSRALSRPKVASEASEAKVDLGREVGVENGNTEFQRGTSYPLHLLSYVSASGTISGADLDKLINVSSVKLSVTGDSPEPAAGACQRCSPPVRTVGNLREVLDLQGVPPELVGVLKPYHQFVADLSDGLEPKNRTAANNFLDKLVSLTQSQWSEASYDPVVGLYTDYLVLFGEIANGVADGKEESARDMLDCLESARLRILNLDESVAAEAGAVLPEHRPPDSPASEQSWASCGVWNARTQDLYSGMMAGQCCVRYRSGHQLRKLQGNMQKVQRLQLQLEVLDMLLSEVLPRLSSRDPDFGLAYKTCSALCSLEKLMVPAIVKVV